MGNNIVAKLQQFMEDEARSCSMALAVLPQSMF